MRKPWLAAVVLALVATACRAEANFGLDVVEDGSGTLTAEFGIDDELLGLLEDFGGDTEDILSEISPEVGDVETRREGDMTYYSATRPFSDEAELEAILAEFEESDLTFTTFDLDIADGGARLDAVIEAPDAASAADDLTGVELGANFLSSKLTVRLPGELVETNADEVQVDGALRWDLPLTGGIVEIRAETEAPGGGFPWVPVLVGLAIVLLLAGVLWYLARKRRSGSEAIAATTPPPPPEPVFGDVQPVPDGDESRRDV